VTADPYHLPCAVADQRDTDKHLPECKALDAMPEATKMFRSTSTRWFWEHGCICDRLRTCELRVRTEPFDVAYRAGLDAAEAAVAAAACYVMAIGTGNDIPERPWLKQETAIAAIRGLRQTRTENGTGVTQELGHQDRGMNLQESHSAADKNHTHDPLCPVNQYRGFPDPTPRETPAWKRFLPINRR